MITVRADGLDWPLETYLDARGFIRTNGEVPDFATLFGAVDVVTSAGELREGCELREIVWHDVLAVAIPAGSMKLDLCPGCGAWPVPIIIRQVEGKIELQSPLCDECEGERW